ncbi:MAG: cupin-like domain-containing protein [Ginsengibacter sp.]
MDLKSVDTVETISPEIFKKNYYNLKKPLVIKDLAKQWPAYQKWNWDYLKDIVGDVKVGLYNNVKSDAYTPINTADDYKPFGEYIDMIRKGPSEWRIFLFNIFEHAPELTKDFIWPEHLMNGFVKRYPMLFTGGQTSITHMHFDIDLSHIVHTQFMGKKRVLLFPYEEQHKLYRKPFEVLSLVDFSNYYLNSGNPDTTKFPAIKLAKGYEVILDHGDTLFMPAGFWHHMEYLESGFAMSLRALQSSLSGKLHGVWNLFGMRSIDTVLKKTLPKPWYNYKIGQIEKFAANALQTSK